MSGSTDTEVIPLLEERAHVERRVVELSSATLKIETREHVETLSGELLSEAYIVERRPVGRFVEVSPQVRTEGETTVYPVVEEVLEKRLLLREEVRITRQRTLSPYSEAVALRRQDASVEQREPASAPSEPTHIKPLEEEASS